MYGQPLSDALFTVEYKNMNPERNKRSETVSAKAAGAKAVVNGVSRNHDHRVSVVIVNFNTGKLLSRVVDRVFAQSEPPVQCIVVDNASTDDSVAQLRESCSDPRLEVIEEKRNLGFAAGCNRGIAQVRGGYVLLLNPDCFLDTDALELLRTSLQAEPDAAAAGPLILNLDGTEQRGCRREFPTPWQIFCVGLGLHRLMPNHPRFRSFNLDNAALPEAIVTIQSGSGACLLIKAKAIEQVGLFDERYFLHFEDLDWCLRARQSGRTIIFVPRAITRHVGGFSGRNRLLRVEAHRHASLIRFVRRNFVQFYPSSFIVLVSILVYLRWCTVVMRTLLLGRAKKQRGWYNLFIESNESFPTADETIPGPDQGNER